MTLAHTFIVALNPIPDAFLGLWIRLRYEQRETTHFRGIGGYVASFYHHHCSTRSKCEKCRSLLTIQKLCPSKQHVCQCH